MMDEEMGYTMSALQMLTYVKAASSSVNLLTFYCRFTRRPLKNTKLVGDEDIVKVSSGAFRRWEVVENL